MSENQISEPKASFGEQAKWLLGIFFRPKKIFNKIARQASGMWFLPLLIMSILTIAYAGVSARTSTPFTAMNMQEMDSGTFSQEIDAGTMIMEGAVDNEGGEYNFNDSQQTPAASKSSALLKGIGGVIRVWGSWLILSMVLYLSLTLSGGRTESFHLLNIVAWAGLPLALRDLVRIVGISLTHTAILNPGLSGLLSANAGGSLALFLGSLFGLLDIYLFWKLGLLVLGGKTVSGLGIGKSLKAVLIHVLILLALYALAGTGMNSLVQQIMEGASFVEDF